MQKLNLILQLALVTLGTSQFSSGVRAETETVRQKDDELTYATAAAPLFKKYCNACHNATDNEGGLSLVTPKEIAQGGEHGPAILPGNAKASRLVRMIKGTLEPKMPPEDMEGPAPEELQALIDWIDKGAKVDARMSLSPTRLTVPAIKSRVEIDPVADLSWSPDGKRIAIARYQRIEILDGGTKEVLFELKDLPGKVSSVDFSADSRFILAATGVTGLSGIAVEWDIAKRKKVREYKGHSDIICSAVYSPDSKQVATAGFDRKIILWDRDEHSKEPIKALQIAGHNDVVYALEYSTNADVLASASGDQTVKLWDTRTGKRLDTLSQPLKEQLVARFHPGGEFVLGAGRDNRIRSWKFESRADSRINPLLISRYAHEASIVALAFSQDGKILVSSAEDKTIKVWSGEGVELIARLPVQPDVAFGLDISPGNELAVGRMDGTVDFYRLTNEPSDLSDQAVPLNISPAVLPNSTGGQPPKILRETEPNSAVVQAQTIEIPAILDGKFEVKPEPNKENLKEDVDYFKFRAARGETWVLETNAARRKSPADTKIEVLDLKGDPVPRVRLQAVRDSYFTFRGKDANTSDDFRVHNWEEMELNELLYCNGEVVRLFLYPRGPDSGFKVYPGFGNRYNFFDTTPVAHALHEPCYIVKAFPPGVKLVPNGLPVFDLVYENDDEAQRKLGSDSKLFFTAPESGQYLIRVTDARGFQGEEFHYQLNVRSPKPDFSVKYSGQKISLKRGSGREFSLNATRIDNYQGPIDVYFENPPPGIVFPEKITIEANHLRAYGTCFAKSNAQPPTAEQLTMIKIVAVAMINGKEVRKELPRIEELKLEDSPKIQARIVPSIDMLDEKQKQGLFKDDGMEPVVLTIQPGTTISASLVIKRNKHGGDVDFGNAESGRNLPHGVFVDNIGLNGLRIIKGQGDKREIFITAAKWVPEQTRLFHLRANNVEGETTFPVLLKIKK